MRGRRTVLSVAAWTLVAALPGCTGKKPRRAAAAKEASAAEASGSDAAPKDPAAKGAAPAKPAAGDEALARKLNALTACLNEQSPHVFDAERAYLAWVTDPKAGPTCKEAALSDLLGSYKVWAIDGCSASLAAAVAASDGPPALDAAAKAYAKALPPAHDQIVALDRYYAHKDYKDDRCAKGKKAHAPLMKALAAFGAGDAALRDAIDAELTRLKRLELEAIEHAYGKGPFYQARHLLLDAKLCVNAMERYGLKATADKKAFAAALAPVEATMSALLAAFAAKPAEAQRFAGLQGVKIGGDLFLKFAKEARRVGDWGPKGRPARFSAYQAMVQAYNGLVRAANGVQPPR